MQAGVVTHIGLLYFQHSTGVQVEDVLPYIIKCSQRRIFANSLLYYSKNDTITQAEQWTIAACSPSN